MKKNAAKNYYSDIRWDIIGLVEGKNNKILEIGCAQGETSAELLKQKKAYEVVGIEIMPQVAKIAQTKIHKVICGDIETIELNLNKGYFDYIIVADVIEHTKDPLSVLKKIKPFLKNNGFILASIPNIRFWKVILNLILKGQWNYTESGVLDKTHLRFFAKKNMIQLFQSAGFEIKLITPKFKLQKKNRYNTLNKITLRFLENFLTFQYTIKAQKNLEFESAND